MPDKERLIKLLSDYGISDRYIPDLCDEIEECYADELADAEKWRKVMVEMVREIEALIDGQRCEWTHNAEYYPNLYHTSCGKVLSEDSPEQRPFCPCCGKRIEVKDGQ